MLATSNGLCQYCPKENDAAAGIAPLNFLALFQGILLRGRFTEGGGWMLVKPGFGHCMQRQHAVPADVVALTVQAAQVFHH